MENYLLSVAGQVIPGTLVKARDNQQTRLIESLMLDGSVSVQVIGQPTTRVSCELICDLNSRRQIQNSASNGLPLTVCWEDKAWTGIVGLSGLVIEPIVTPYWERVKFDLLVSEVSDR